MGHGVAVNELLQISASLTEFSELRCSEVCAVTGRADTCKPSFLLCGIAVEPNAKACVHAKILLAV